MCTISQLNTISRQMVECYRSVYGVDSIGIFLYGSYARGDYKSDSDIDITAIVNGDRKELQQKLKIVWDVSADIGLENDVIVSPTVIPYDDFFITSKQDAEEQYQKALEFYQTVKNYLEVH